MNTLYALMVSLMLNAVLGWTALHEYGTVRADTANCNTLRTADAKAANDAVLKAVEIQSQKDADAADLMRQNQAKADADHEKVMLDIQRRQDAAKQHFGDASHDAKSLTWAAQPVPLPYYLGLCAVLGHCPDVGSGTPAGAIAQSRPQGPGADSGDASGPEIDGFFAGPDRESETGRRRL